jgi:lipoprotein NlpI
MPGDEDGVRRFGEHMLRKEMMRYFVKLLILAGGLTIAEAALADPTAPSTDVPVYAVLSLIGDSLTIVGRMMETGTHLDPNSHKSVAIADPIFDNTAVQAAAKAVRKEFPIAEVAALNSRSKVLFDDQHALFEVSGEVMSMPDAIKAALREQHATKFVLIGKQRDDANFEFANGIFSGRGKLEGLGFFLDGTTGTASVDPVTGKISQSAKGFIAPYAYIQVVLVDFPSCHVQGKRKINGYTLAGSGRAESDHDHPWDALSPAEKARHINQLVERKVAKAVRELVSNKVESNASADPIEVAKAGVIAAKRGTHDEAIGLFNTALDSGELFDNERASVLYNRGGSWADKKDYDRAIADYTEAIRLDPQYATAFNYRGNAWYSKMDYDRAIADYTDAIRLNPQYATAFNSRGNAWSSKKDYDRAIADYTETIRLDPKNAQALNNRGKAQFYQGKFSSAALDFAQFQKINPSTYTALWLYLARVRGGDAGANVELTSNANSIAEKKWPAPVVELYRGIADPVSVTSLTADPDLKTQNGQLCEANFYVGQWHLLHSDIPQARALFIRAQNECPKNFYEYRGAVAELERLK